MALSQKEKDRLKTKYGPWAVVTGASSGIGLELAERLAESGLNLIVSARRGDQLTILATRLTNTYGVAVKPVAADLGQQNAVDLLIKASDGLNIGLLVASAGFGTSGNFLKADLAQEVAMLRVNCEALLMLTHHFSRQFAAQRRGGIILMSSMVGFQGVPFAAHYAATKAYVQSLAEALAVELKPQGIDVLAAAPGPVESSFGQRANMQMSMSLTPAQVGTPILKALGRQATVLPGLLTKFLVGSLRTVPRWAKILIMRQVMGGMTKHQYYDQR
ncbi:SDR family NAD(P)-dependent oxidoreductase [Fibrella aquatilis]|uniref:SDR family oxidoreductase n=1 Tax=Fibrella aquatilis TaxID=2817059 RepID=A0A939G929_9BACT|nr:SDR family oxidoreductase [Fibrella aquatilis]MBO0932879.1 SDR family oxidoreductase [Fibrella aquatilis]